MILLDIPQGAITIASAILVVVGGALVTFAVFLIRELFSVKERLKGMETLVTPNDAEQMKTANIRVEILWEEHLRGVRNIGTVDSPENPMKQERWDELTNKLDQQELSDDEAEEFLAALLKREEQARQEKDAATLVILGHGIVLTKWRLKEKELREQK